MCHLITADFNFFIYDLFNDTVSSSDYKVSNGRKIVINELVRMWKEMVMAFVRRKWENLHLRHIYRQTCHTISISL